VSDYDKLDWTLNEAFPFYVVVQIIRVVSAINENLLLAHVDDCRVARAYPESEP
jgi:hypothetical protein